MFEVGSASAATVGTITVTSTVGATTGDYLVGDTIKFSAPFSEAVSVSGSPKLDFVINDSPRPPSVPVTRQATYVSADSTSTSLAFAYTVTDTDFDHDGLSIPAGAIDLNSGSITTTSSSTAADLGNPAGNDLSSHKIHLRPDGEVVRIASTPASVSAGYVTGETIRVAVTWDQKTRVITAAFGTTGDVNQIFAGTPAIMIKMDPPDGGDQIVRLARYAETSSDEKTLFFDYVVQPDDYDAGGITTPTAGIVRDGAIVRKEVADSIAAFVRADDGSSDLNIQVGHKVNVNRPTVSSIAVTSTPDTGDTYGDDETIEVSVTFSAAVTVDTTGGTPYIEMSLQSAGVSAVAKRNFTYTSGSGTTVLVFEYEVDSADDDNDGIAVAADAIELDGGTIRSANGSDAILLHAADTFSSHKVDGDGTVAVTVEFAAASYSATEGGTDATVTVNLSADPQREVAISITGAVANGASSNDFTITPASVTISSGSTSGTFTVKATDDDFDDDGETVTLSFGTLPAGVTASGQTTASVSIADDDERGVIWDPDPLRLREVAAGGTAVTGAFTVRLASAPTAETVAQLKSDPGASVSMTSGGQGSVTFDASDWDSPQSVDVATTADAPASQDLDAEIYLDFDDAAAGSDYKDQDLERLPVAIFDATAPLQTGASINGDQLVLTYNQALDEGSVPAAAQFAVTVDASAVTVSSVDIDGMRVTLTLNSAAESGDSVSISYTVPTSNPIQDPDANLAAALTDVAVNNIAAPTLSSAVVLGDTLTLTYSGTLDNTSTPATSHFSVSIDNSPVNVTGVSISGATVTLTLASRAQSGDTVSLSYGVPSSNPIRGSDGGGEAAALTNQPVTNNTRTGTDATLSAISLEDGDGNAISFSPAFDSATADYTATVTADIARITVAGTPMSNTATLAYSPADADGDTSGHQANLRYGDTTITLTVTSGDTTNMATYKVKVTRQKPTVTLSSNNQVTEGASTVTLTVTLSPAVPNDVVVEYETLEYQFPDSEGHAYAGQDFTGASGSVTVDAGETSATFDIAILDDALDEHEKTFWVDLSIPSGTQANHDGALSTVFIFDDDDEPSISLADASAEEGEAVEFTASLSEVSGRKVSVGYSTSVGANDTATSGTDFTAVTNETLEIAAGQTSGTISIASTEDTDFEDDETFTLTLLSPNHATLNSSPLRATGTINDDDPLSKVGGVAVERLDGKLKISWTALTLADGYELQWKSGAQAYSAASSDDRQAEISSGSTTSHELADLDNGTVYDIRLRAVKTGLADGPWSDEVSAMPRPPNTSATGQPTVSGTARVAEELTVNTSAIVDSDVIDANSFEYQWLRVDADGTSNETEISGATGATYTLASDDRDKKVKVRVDFLDGYGYEESATSAAYPATGMIDKPFSAIATLQALALNRVGGTAFELNNAFTPERVNYRASVGAGRNQVTVAATATHSGATLAFDPATDADATEDGHQVTLPIGESDIEVTVTSEDGTETQTYTIRVTRAKPGIRFSNPSGNQLDESAGSYIVELRLSPAVNEVVKVDYWTIDPPDPPPRGMAKSGKDFTYTAGTLTFAAGETSKTITVPILDDTLDEPSELFSMNFKVVERSNAEFRNSPSLVDIFDNDPTPTIGVADATAEEGDPVEFTVSLSAASGQEIRVQYETAVESGDTAVSGTHFTAVSASSNTELTIPPETATATISIPTTDNTTPNADRTFTLKLSSPTNADLDSNASSATGTIANDDRLAQVTGVSAVPGESKITVGWTAVTNAEGYRIQWKSGAQDYSATQSDNREATVSSGSTTSHEITGLANGTGYTVRVAATHAGAGDGPWSSEKSATPVGTDTTAPTLSSATVNGAALVLTYDENLDANSTPAANAFAVTVAGSAVTVSGVAIDGATVTLALATGAGHDDTVTLDYTAPSSGAIQDAAGNEVEDLDGQAVTNDTPDTTAPSLSAATVEGAALVLTFSESLDGTSTPAAGSFTVTVAGSAVSVSGVAVSGNEVTLTLATPAGHGDAVSVSYDVPATGRIQDDSGNAAGAITSASVTNNTPDTTAPTLSSATVNGATLTLTYDETLDGTSTPATSAFEVTVGSSAFTVNNVAVSGATVTLTLSTAVGHGDRVSLDYTAPSSGAIRDEAGNDAASLTGQSVTNNTADTTAPTLSSATVDGDTLVLTYNEALDSASTPATSDFDVMVGSSDITVNNVAVSGAAVTLTLSTAAAHGDAVTLSYTAPQNNPIRDESGNDAASLTSQSVTNNTADTTAPTLSSATVNGATLTLTYDEALDSASTPATSDFDVTAGSSAVTVNNVAVGGAAVTLTLSTAVEHGDRVTLDYSAPASGAIQDAAGNKAEDLVGQAVTNDTPDTTAPTLSSATVNGASLVLTYDEALDDTSTPPTSAFAVTVAGSARAVSSVAIDGAAVTLTLSSPAGHGQQVTLSYTVPQNNPIRDESDNEAAALNGESVTNETPDTTAPALSSATVNGAALTLTYDEALDDASTPATSAFDVTVAGSAVTVNNVAVSGATVTLTLSTAAGHGDSVSLSYTAPQNSPIQDGAGNDAASLSGQSVTNNTADTTAPTLSSATVDGVTLVLTYNEALDDTSPPPTSAFTVTVAGSTRTVSSIAISGAAVTLTLATAVEHGDTVTLDYTVPLSAAIQDEAGNDAASLTGQSVTNNTADTTAPTLSSATVDGATLVLTYNEALDDTSTPAAGAFGVTVGSSDVTVNNVAISGAAVTLTLATAVEHGDTVTLDYGVPSSGAIRDEAGNDAASLTGQSVTNNTADTAAPTLSSATVNGTALRLTYDEALDGASTPATSAFTVTVADSSVAVSSVAVNGAAVTLTLSTAVEHGDRVTLDYTAPASGAIQDAAGNKAGDLAGQAVTNDTPDTTAPALSSATVNGATLTLTYDEDLDGASTPATSAFAVTVAGSTRAVSSVAISGAAVTLTLSSPVGHAEQVTLSYAAPQSNPIRDTSENGADSLTDESVTNETPDTTAPALSSATVNGATLTLTYDEALDDSSTPAASAFAVTVAGSSVTVSGVAIDGATVTLTLTTAAGQGDSVSLSYTAPQNNPIQDEAGNDAAALTDRSVTNNTADTTAPTLSSATVDGATLVLTYNEVLDSASTPATSAFDVTVDSSAVTVNNVAVSGATVTLTLSTAVEHGDRVSLDYTAPSSGTIRDESGNDAVALSGQSVTNNTADTTAPALSSATVNGATLVLTYSETLDGASTPATSAFAVTVADSSVAVNNVAVSGAAVTLTLSTAAAHGDTVSLDYTPPASGAIQDAAGNDAASLSGQSVTNDTADTTAPTLSSATVNGATLVLTYNEALDSASTPATSAFAVTVAGSSVTVNNVAVSGAAVTLTLSTAAAHGDTVSLDYTPPASGAIRDESGNDAASLSGQSVTNNTADTTAPTLSSATVNGAALVLTYDETLDDASTPAASAFAVTVAGSTRAVSSVAVSGAAVTLTLSSPVGHGQQVTLSYTAPQNNPIRDTSENSAVSLSDESVTNETPDTTAPALSSATVNGTTLVLTYNEALDDTSTPAASDFEVTVASSDVTVNNVAVSGATVTLTLATAAAHGDTVTLDYTPPASGAIQDAAGNDAASLTDRSVTNNTADTTAPALSSATVDGTALTLTYDEALDSASTPATSDFEVTVGSSAVTVNNVAVSGATVTLTLSTAVGHGDRVSLDYTAPLSGAIRDAAGNDAASLTDRSVTNDTADTTAPALSSATVDGATLVLTYNEALDSASTPAASDFEVTVGSSAVTVNNVAVSGSAVTLTLSTAVEHGDRVSLDYTAPLSGAIRDAAGNDAASLSGQSVTNNTADTTAPTLSSATVDGATLVLTYDEALDGASTPATSAFEVTVGSSAVTVNNVAISGATVTLTLSTGAGHGDTVTLDYTAPASGAIQDAAGNKAGDLAGQAVTNDTPDTTAPALSSATVNGATLTLTYDEDLDGASTPATSAFAVTVAGSTRAVSSVAISGAAVTLTLSSPVGHAEQVTLSYAAPQSNPIRDTSENGADSLTDESVTNETPDTTAPALSSATVNGATLTLTYDEALDDSSTPAASAFAVTVAGSSVTVSGVAIDGATVTLTLTTAAGQGDSVSLSYTAPQSNPIQDAASNEAAALSGRTVTNATPDTTAPTLSSAAINGAALTLTYDENLDSASVPASIAFEVTVADTSVSVNTVAVSGATVTLTLSTGAAYGDTVSLDYTAPADKALQDAAGNKAEDLDGHEVTNNTADSTAPTLSTAKVNGTSLVLTFSESLDTTSTPAAADFTVTVEGSEVTVSAVEVSGNTVTLTLGSAVAHGETVSVSYTFPETHPIQDEEGNPSASLSNSAVINATPDTSVPVLSGAT